jgi:hypothetical protein
MGMGPLAKKMEWEDKWMDSSSLAMIDNYHLTRKNARYGFVILHGHLWGG